MEHDGVAEDQALVISTGARAQITELAPISEDGCETGGILLGRGPDSRGIVRVEIAGDAGPDADRRPNFFLRDLAHARTLAEDAWNTSRAIWVGEWHTHLRSGPQPSSSDLSTYLRLLAASELQFDLFVSIIVTADPLEGWARPRLWPWLLKLSGPTR